MNKTTFGILTLLLNSYGLPSFLNGNIKKGVFTIVSGVITCGVVAVINAIKGIIMGIKILQMSDADFEAADKASFEDVIVFFCKD